MKDVQHSRLGSVMEGLPRQFVSSLKVLFDILDETRSGYVRLAEIETRWKEDGVRGLPAGVVEALRRVTPSSGYLNFERFVSGLKCALLKSKDSDRRAYPAVVVLEEHGDPIPRLLNSSTTVAVRPNNALNSSHSTGAGRHRNQINDDSIHSEPELETQAGGSLRKNNQGVTLRSSVQENTCPSPQVPPRDPGRLEIMHELKNWQRQRMSSVDRHPSSSGIQGNPESRNGSVYANVENFHQHPEKVDQPVQNQRCHSSRGSSRRHTLTSGVDFAMLKKMKLIEEEKDVLMQGLQTVEKARLWYQKQISGLVEKQKLTGWASLNESSVEASQEKMNFLKTRIMEVNHQLQTLIETSEKGFPMHMNLAISTFSWEEGRVKMLKEQNRQLTQEISQKCEKITQLEQEKASLIREVFETRGRNKPSHDDTTFM